VSDRGAPGSVADRFRFSARFPRLHRLWSESLSLARGIAHRARPRLGKAKNSNTHHGRRSPPIALLLGSGMLLMALIASATWMLASHLRDRALAAAERESRNITFVLAEQTAQAFQAMELAQASVIERMQRLGVSSREDYVQQMSHHDIHLMLKDKIGGLPHINGMAVFDAQGKLVNFSRSWPIPLFNVADRDYFKALTSDAHLTSFVSAPLRNRGNGTWVISFARKVNASNGEFLGLVVGLIELEYFEKFFGAIALEPGSSIALFRRDGTLLARFPRVDSLIGQVFGANALSIRLVEGSGHGVGRMAGVIDGKDRIIAAHAVAHYPIVVTATRAVSAVLSEWRRQAVVLLGAGVLAAFLTGLVIFLMALRVLKEHRLSEQILLQQKQQLEAALDNMSQGLCMFDAEQRLVVSNARYSDIYNLGPGQVRPGTPFLEILEHCVRNGCTPRDAAPEEFLQDVPLQFKRTSAWAGQSLERWPLHRHRLSAAARRRMGGHARRRHTIAQRGDGRGARGAGSRSRACSPRRRLQRCT
jgi:PAS domain-containing protein